MSIKLPELLLPAGDMERLRFACAFGADAVYAGVPRYSLRTRENGFVTPTHIEEAIRYVRSIGKKIYLAMNIFPHNTKVEGMLDAFCAFADMNPDGFIVTDIGIINRMRRLRPNAEIHLSTQANATNWAAVEMYRDLGVKRVVIPRELSLKEIAEIHTRVPDIELEAFIHGSMCMAYSGRCLISNYLTHRDSNQGNCANSCRWQYKLSSQKESLRVVEDSHIEHHEYSSLTGEYAISEPNRPNERFELDEDEHGTYLFNSKDLCAIELLPELMKAGVVSLKVEGRTKSVYYASMVARAYRQALDDLAGGRPFNPQNLHELIGTSNRSLMTGFFLRRPSEYGQNYDDGGSKPLTHIFVGQFVRYDFESKIAWVHVRNKLSSGDMIEWVSPDSIEILQIDRLVNEKGEDKDSISGGLVAGIPLASSPASYTILRREITSDFLQRAKTSEEHYATM